MAKKRMTFTDHLEELRARFIVSLIALALTISISYIFSLKILEILSLPAGDIKLHYLSPLEPLLTRFKVAVFSGIALAFPVLFYEILAFVSPALKKKEKRPLYLGLFFALILFAGGVSFGYFYILPLGVKWLLAQAAGRLSPVLTVSHYISFSGWFLLAFGISFETPLVIFLLVRLGVVKKETLRKKWRYVYIIILIIAAILTPDWNPLTMFLVGVPMIFLYELGMLLTRIF